MSNAPSINTYVSDDGHELTAVPDSQMDLVLRENPRKWARVTERPSSRRSKGAEESTDKPSE